ncbi:23S rRNA (pseudouridine(1915)-N(3))-methyltransferase RlmH [Curtanaerobium respiraculi]|uniref:23S rRNA (pseudouridine(1915)-N(3))-methyltransferase RlmH n=1 Tax=Curtanaerobium respiraculi TaxID=2949669 RepID=UPI00320491EE
MLKITVIATGKLKERFWKEACEEYRKRLGGYVNLTMRELPDSTREREADAQLAAIDALGGAHLFLLDIRGRETGSEALAERIETLAVSGKSHLAFLIGGSDGVSREVADRAAEHLSFGPVTLPHNLARVVLLEQLYRAEKIIHREPYHK